MTQIRHTKIRAYNLRCFDQNLRHFEQKVQNHNQNFRNFDRDFRYFDQKVRDFGLNFWDFNQNVRDFDQHFTYFEQNVQEVDQNVELDQNAIFVIISKIFINFFTRIFVKVSIFWAKFKSFLWNITKILFNFLKDFGAIPQRVCSYFSNTFIIISKILIETLSIFWKDWSKAWKSRSKVIIQKS